MRGMSARWTCPECGRGFGRANAGHTCSPTLDLDEWLAGAPDHERPVAEALISLVEGWDGVVVEPVQVGLFVKRRSTFVSARTRTRWVEVGVKLGREPDDPGPDLAVQWQGARAFCRWRCTTGEDVARLAELIEEAWGLDGG